MFGRTATKFAIWLLKRSDITLSDRHLLTNSVLDKLAALPLRDIIVINESSLIVNGKVLSREEVMQLRESAKAALGSRALGLIRDQVLYKAYTFGVNTSINFDQVYFAKAAVWWGQEEDKILNALASIGNEDSGN